MVDEARLGLRVLCGKRKTFGNLAGRIVPGSNDLSTVAQWIAGQFDPIAQLAGRRMGAQAVGLAN